MTTWGFNEKGKAESLSRFASVLGDGVNGGIESLGTESMIARVPTGETLSALSGTTAGYLECEAITLGGSGDLSDSPNTIEVFNATGTEFLAGSLITCVRIKSVWMVTGGGASGGGGTDTAKMYQFKTTTAIGSGDPTDGSAGSGSANLWAFNGSSWSIDSSALYDIVNPWATTVSSGKMITCYQDPNDTTKYVLVQSECETTSGGGDDGGGTDPPTDPEGYCINDTTGAVTSGVLQSACTGTWSSTEPTTGCCDISGTEHTNVAESWCNANSGTFTEGACPPSFDPCAENAKFTISNFTLEDSYTPNCATTPWVATAGSALGLTYQTGCLKRFYHNASISSSENPAASGGVVDGDVTYRSATDDWLVDGQVRYFNSRTNGTMTVNFIGTAPNAGTDCSTTLITASIVGDGGSYDQPCDFTDATVLTGTITLQMVCN